MCNSFQPGQPSPVQPARYSSLNAFKVVRVAEDQTVGNTRPDAQPLDFNVYAILCPRNVSHTCENKVRRIQIVRMKPLKLKVLQARKWLDPDLDETDIRINGYQTNR